MNLTDIRIRIGGEFILNKKERQSAIIEILSENEAATQRELVELLAKRGYSVSQATLSRDMRDLKIQKSLSENEINCYYLGNAGEELGYDTIFARSAVSIDHAQNIVVVKCHAGMADAACKVIDERNFSAVVGTIAGDDTVFVLVRTENDAVRLITQLKQLTVYN